MKNWYESKIIGLAIISILGAAADGIANGWTWRQYATAAIGVALVVARAFYTDTEIGSVELPKEKK